MRNRARAFLAALGSVFFLPSVLTAQGYEDLGTEGGRYEFPKAEEEVQLPLPGTSSTIQAEEERRAMEEAQRSQRKRQPSKKGAEQRNGAPGAEQAPAKKGKTEPRPDSNRYYY